MNTRDLSPLLFLPLWIFAGGCGAADDSEASSDPTAELPPISVSGHAFEFTLPGTSYGRIAGATLSILEMPEITTTTDEEGAFTFAELPVGEEASFIIVADGYPETQTKTFVLPAQDITQLTFQVPTNSLYDAMASLLNVEIDDQSCNLVSTVTVPGKSIYDSGAHGEAGATVTLDPLISSDMGPIYFNEQVLPDPTRVESSDDGGVVFVNIPPATYVMEAHKADLTVQKVTAKCRAGVLVNASPPYGLQAL